MDTLTNERRAQLLNVLQELERLPTPELIVESARLRVPVPLDKTGRKRMQLAYAGAYAYEKLGCYLETLRQIDDQRIRVNSHIIEFERKAEELRRSDPLASVEPQLMARHLAGMLEVVFHLFAVCVAQMERLLPVVARSAGYTIPKADLATLASYVPLRHHYEHLNERLPGGVRQREIVTELEDENEWHVKIGFEIDEQSRIVIDGQAIDVTTRGVWAIEEIFQRLWEPLRRESIEAMRKHYERHPGEVTGPGHIQKQQLVSVNATMPRDVVGSPTGDDCRNRSN